MKGPDRGNCLSMQISQAKAAEESGDHVAATEYRRKARKWNITGIVVGTLLCLLAAVVFFILIGVAIYFNVLSDRLKASNNYYSQLLLLATPDDFDATMSSLIFILLCTAIILMNYNHIFIILNFVIISSALLCYNGLMIFTVLQWQKSCSVWGMCSREL